MFVVVTRFFSIWLYNSHTFWKFLIHLNHVIMLIHFSIHFPIFSPPKKLQKITWRFTVPVTLQAMTCGMISKVWGWEGFLRLQGSLGMVENGTLNRKISDSSWKKISNLSVTFHAVTFALRDFGVAFEGAMDVGMRAILVRTGKYRPGDEELCRPAPLAVVDCHLGSNWGNVGFMGCSNHEILGCFFCKYPGGGGKGACYWIHAALATWNKLRLSRCSHLSPREWLADGRMILDDPWPSMTIHDLHFGSFLDLKVQEFVYFPFLVHQCTTATAFWIVECIRRWRGTLV